MRLRSLALTVSALVLSMPAAALADWRRAETAHFVIYSDGTEANLRDYAERLERFDGLLHHLANRAPSADRRKFPVYLLGDRRDLQTVQPNLPDGIGGFYRASEHDIRAILVRRLGDELLLHEYGHHFMSQNFPGGYPGWFREGFAEYFMTATIDARGKATFGLPDPGRLRALAQLRWLPIDQVLTATPLLLEDRGQRGAFYAQSWLLTHYMLAEPSRRAKLDAYLAEVSQGGEPVAALQSHFGMTPDQLQAALRAYLAGRMQYAELQLSPSRPEMEVTTLPASADDLMLLWLDVSDGAPASAGVGLLEQARNMAARHPGDAFAALVLGRSELLWGDRAAGRKALRAVLQAQPDNVDAMVLLAQNLLDEGGDTAATEAGALLTAARAAAPRDYRVLAMLASERRSAPDYPTEEDLGLWLQAVQIAPQVWPIRGRAADAMLAAGESEAAELLLLPMANDPHDSRTAQQARQRLARIRGAEPTAE